LRRRLDEFYIREWRAFRWHGVRFLTTESTESAESTGNSVDAVATTSVFSVLSVVN